MSETVDEFKFDWYKVLDCNSESSRSHIEKAARKLFLKYHPDKTTDPEAPALFLQVQKAKEFLLDDTKRKVLDDTKKQVTVRQKYDDERSKNMDVRRKRMRDDLEQKLAQAKKGVPVSQPFSGQSGGNTRQKEQTIDLDRLRREGASLREASARDAESKEAKRKFDQMSQKKTQIFEAGGCQLKVKWKRSRQSHSDESLVLLFKCFGSIESVIMVGDKGNAAEIIFSEELSAKNAVSSYEASTEYRVTIPSMEFQENKKRAAIFTHVYASSGGNSQKGAEVLSTNPTDSNRDSDLMRQMRRAVEREELIRKLGAEEVTFNGSSCHNGFDKPPNSEGSSYSFSAASVAVSVPTEAVSTTSLASKESDILQKMIEVARLKKLKKMENPPEVP